MTWMGPGSSAKMAMDLSRMGWKVRQVAGRRIWYKGRAGAEIVARGMQEATQMEMTLRRTRAPSLFMYGPDVAELLGAYYPGPIPKPKTMADLMKHVAEAEYLIRELMGHEGAEGWSEYLRKRLDAFIFRTEAKDG